MVKTLAKLQAECAALGIQVEADGRAGKEPFWAALRQHFWEKDHPGECLPDQTEPMLLGSWEDLDPAEAQEIENDHHSWCVQQKMDGIRALVHIRTDGIRITGRAVSEVTFRLTEHQDSVKHLGDGWDSLEGSIVDGELVCPTSVIDTGSSSTASPLQAAVAILATSPEKAASIQIGQNAHLEFHAFDVLRHQGQDVTTQPLYERLALLERILGHVKNPCVKLVPTVIVGKRSFHNRVLDSGGEGTVWKSLDALYSPGCRVRHWLKRKRGVEVEAFVSGFKPGNNGHAHLVGALEFSVHQVDGSTVPVAWVSGLPNTERRAMTEEGPDGGLRLKASYLGRRALIGGQDKSAKAARIRHAKVLKWIA